jgi:hypothetical protein
MQVDEQVCRKLIGLKVHQTGNSRLGNAKKVGGLVLRHAARLYEPAEAIHQLGAGLEMLHILGAVGSMGWHVTLVKGSYGSMPSSF